MHGRQVLKREESIVYAYVYFYADVNEWLLKDVQEKI